MATSKPGKPNTWSPRPENFRFGTVAPIAPTPPRQRPGIEVNPGDVVFAEHIFGNDGRLYMPLGILVPQENTSLEVYARGAGASINSLRVHRMKSAWKS
jgi:hypothetical protein